MRSVACAFALIVLAGCGDPEPDAYQGYVEGEYVLVAAPFGGALVDLKVARGDTVQSGAALFTLEQGNEVAGKREAEERLQAAQARFGNLTTGLRAPELEALLAEAKQAQAAHDLSASELKRIQKLYEQGFVSAARADEARWNLDRDRARVERAHAEIRAAQQTVGRSGELAAAKA
jgi:HlyD family secretion protein